MSSSVERYHSLLENLKQTNIASTSQEIDELIDADPTNQIISFVKAIFNIIPARYLSLEIYATLKKQLHSFTTSENKEYFKKQLIKHVSQSNNEIVSVFLIHLLRSSFFSTEDIFFILNEVLKNSHKLSNDVFNQIILCITEGSAELSKENLNELENIYTQIQDRQHVIQSGLFQDENTPIFEDFFDYLTEIRSNHWIIPDDFPLKNIIDSLKTDDVESLKSMINSKEEADTKLNPSILLAAPILGFSPPYVSLASFFGAIKCLEYLKNIGADLLQEDDEGVTPIQFALAGGNMECVQFLKKNSELSMDGCLEISIEYLNRDGFNWLIQNISDLTSGLEDSVNCPYHAAAKVNSIYFTKKLIEYSVPHMTKDDYDWTPLHIAASYDSTDVLKILINLNGTDINVSDLDGDTALHCASKDGCIDALKVLLESNQINVNAFDRHNATPLHYAAMYNQAQAVKILLADQRTNINILDAYEHSPLQIAAIYGSAEAAEVIAADDRINPNTKDIEGNFAIHNAVTYGETNIVSAVLSARNINLEVTNKDNVTAAELAAFQKKPEILKILIEKGANINSLRTTTVELAPEIRAIINLE